MGIELGSIVRNLIGIDAPYKVTATKSSVDEDIVEVGITFESSDSWVGESFGVDFAFKVSHDHKKIILVGELSVSDENVELFGQDIINNFMKKLRDNKKIVRIDMKGEGDNTLLNVTLK